MSRTEERKGINNTGRIQLLEADTDRIEAKIDHYSLLFEGVLVALTLTAIALAANLVFR
jgi:hypothetical protein